MALCRNSSDPPLASRSCDLRPDLREPVEDQHHFPIFGRRRQHDEPPTVIDGVILRRPDGRQRRARSPPLAMYAMRFPSAVHAGRVPGTTVFVWRVATHVVVRCRSECTSMEIQVLSFSAVMAGTVAVYSGDCLSPAT